MKCKYSAFNSNDEENIHMEGLGKKETMDMEHLFSRYWQNEGRDKRKHLIDTFKFSKIEDYKETL